MAAIARTVELRIAISATCATHWAVIRSKRCRIEARSTRVACRAGETRHRAPNAARSSLLHGEFGTYHEWADLDCSRRTGVPPSLMLKADAVLLSKIFRGHV